MLLAFLNDVYMEWSYSEGFKEKVNHDGIFSKSKIRTVWPHICPMPIHSLLKALNTINLKPLK